MSSIVFKGDISGLTTEQKMEYFRSLCERLDIDPLTQPFQILRLQGKEVLYCTKAGTEQLSNKHKVSHEIRKTETLNDVYIVHVRASTSDGRFVDSSGVVSLKDSFGKLLTGNDLPNAIMKAETKAKRRATLSIVGLGMIDETEIETIKDAKPVKIEINPIKVGEKPAPTGSFAMGGGGEATCSDCKKEISSQRVVQFSTERFGEPVCYDCQQERTKQPQNKPTYLAQGKDENNDGELYVPELHENVI